MKLCFYGKHSSAFGIFKESVREINYTRWDRLDQGVTGQTESVINWPFS